MTFKNPRWIHEGWIPFSKIVTYAGTGVHCGLRWPAKDYFECVTQCGLLKLEINNKPLWSSAD